MATDRMKRVNELMKREIGSCLFRIIKEPNFDTSALTVTHVMTSRNLRTARVLISIRDHQSEREEILAIIKRYRTEIQKHINDHLKLKYTPRLSFILDSSLESGDRVLEILSEIEDDPEEDL